MQKIKLFCLPYAGGNAVVFAKWKEHLKDFIELRPVEMAGRGRKFKTPFYETMQEAVNDIFSSIESELDDSEYAIFGHSMGSIIAYELICKIKELRRREPLHAFFSGRYPPHIKKYDKIVHKMPEEEFKEEIFNLGGTPKEFFENKELLDIFVPILRADYKILETYNHIPREEKFNFDITTLTGKEDPEISPGEMEQWERYTGRRFKIHEFEGGHFFINEKMVDVISIVNNTLTRIINNKII